MCVYVLRVQQRAHQGQGGGGGGGVRGGGLMQLLDCSHVFLDLVETVLS